MLIAATHTQERKAALCVSSATCVGFSDNRRAEWPKSPMQSKTSLRYRGQLSNPTGSGLIPTVSGAATL